MKVRRGVVRHLTTVLCRHETVPTRFVKSI